MRRAPTQIAGSNGWRSSVVRGLVAGPLLAVAVVAAACGSDSSGDVLSTEFVLFDSGAPATLADYAGTPLVVNLWASTCPNCIAEMPDFEQVHQALGDEVTFIGMNTQDDHGAAEELRQTTGVTYTLGFDDEGRFYDLFESFAMPTTAFITASGDVADVWIGQMTVETLTENIDEHLLGIAGLSDAGPSDAGAEDAGPTDESASGSAGVEPAAATADDTFVEAKLARGPGSSFVPLDDPVLIEAEEATWLDPDDIVMGIVGDDGSSQAYPVDQMAYHHIANTSLSGEPFVVTY